MKKMRSQGSLLLYIILVVAALHACKKDKEEKTGVSISGISASHAKAGATITISGAGFIADAAKNSVSFNGKNAEVVKATTTQLDVKVPVNGTTGKIKVSNTNGMAESSTTFDFDPTADFTFTTEANLLPGEAKLTLVSTALSATKVKWILHLPTPVVADETNTLSWWIRKSGPLTITLIAYSGEKTDTLVRDIQITTDNSLLAYYRLNGDGAEDLNKADAQKVNTVSSTDRWNIPNGAVEFNGANAYLKLPKSLIKNAGSAISICLWYKSDDLTKAGAILGYQNTDVGGTPANFTPSLYVGTNKKMHAKFWFGTDPIITPEDVNTNWHHLALTGDANNQILYIDGVNKGSMGNGVDILHDMIYNQLGAAYGGGVWPNIPAGWFYFKGKMDDLAFYKKKLTAAEVKAVYDFQKL